MKRINLERLEELEAQHNAFIGHQSTPDGQRNDSRNILGLIAELKKRDAAAKVLMDGLKFYAGEDWDGRWDENRFIGLDKFGSVFPEICGPRVAIDSLAEARKLLE